MGSTPEKRRRYTEARIQPMRATTLAYHTGVTAERYSS
jgi:hypothetical protein